MNITNMAKGKGRQRKEGSKWLSRKWLVGVFSWIAGISFAILDDNNIVSIPWWVIAMLLGITFTWLVTEGYLDRRSFEYLERFGILKKK